MKIITIENFDQFKNILENNNEFIINISATWCKPCQNIKKDLENFVTDYNSDILFLKLDYDIYDEDDDFTDKLIIKKVPTFCYFKEKNCNNEIISSDINLIKKFISDNITENITFNIDDNF